MRQFSIPAICSPRPWITGTVWLALLPGLSAVELYTSDTEEPEPRSPEIRVVVESVSLNDGGSEAAFQEVTRREENPNGGIEYFYWENDPYEDWRTFLEGWAVNNFDETNLDLEVQNGESVFFDLQFRRWSTYAYGNGIWYPPTGTFAVLSADALERKVNNLDISLKVQPGGDNLWGRLSYTFFNRQGKGLSTRFGDNYPFEIGGRPSRGIIPALNDSDEEVHTLDFQFVHEDGTDRTGLRAHYQHRSSERTHIVERGAEDAAANRFTTTREDGSDDLFSLSGFTRTRLGKKVVGSLGFAFTRLDGDLTGSRLFGSAPEAEYDIDFPALQLHDRGYLDLENSRSLKQWIFNANAVYTPSGNTRLMAGIRLENLSTEAFSSYIDTHFTIDFGALELQREEAATLASSAKTANDVSAFLEARYSGFNRLLLFTRLEGSVQNGDLEEDWSREELVPDTGTMADLLARATESDRNSLFWEAGLNFYPKAGLHFSLKGYLKYRDNDYDWEGAVLPPDDFTEYPAYFSEQTFLTRDINGRVTWRLTNSLRSVSRVDFQVTTIDSETDGRSSIESSERERIVFDQSLVWTPNPRLFVSGSFHWVEDLTETGAASLEGTFGGIVVDIPNDYWQADLNLFYVISKRLDLQLGYQYLEMSNYLDNSPATVPYGTELTRHHGSAKLFFHFTPRTRVRIGYDYYEHDEPSAGGNRGFTAHIVSGSYQLIF